MGHGASPIRINTVDGRSLARLPIAACFRQTTLESVLALIIITALKLVLWSAPVWALDPSLDVSQYAHTAWTAQIGFSVGTIFAMVQTPDGYLWLGSEFGLFRFDGVRAIPWQPPAGQHLPSAPYSLLVTRDGTLWIGTYAGLAAWNGGKLTRYPELDGQFVTSLLEARDGTVWAGTLAKQGQLCAIRGGRAQCFLNNGAFGSFIWSLGEDNSGTLWAGADTGVWRWKPSPPRRYAMPGMRVGDLSRTDGGRLLIGMDHAGLKQFDGDKVKAYPVRNVINPKSLLPDRDVDSNKLLRDRDAGLWIGTHRRGLIHIHHGQTDVFTQADGLSGDIICSLFEDREGNVWVGTNRGLDRFRKLPVTTISAKQGLSSTYINSVLATTDGSIWVATHDGLTRWKSGQSSIFRKSSGLPDDLVQSLYQDDRGRIWVFTGHGLAIFEDGKFVAVQGVSSEQVFSMTEDNAGDLWLSGNEGLWHLRDGRLVEIVPWSAFGHQQGQVLLFDREGGGIWLSFRGDGGVLYFKDGRVLAKYTAADGLGVGPVTALQLDRDGALWAATHGGGLSRIKDGHIATLATGNGLPCGTIHWSMEDNDGSLWLYTACGLVRIRRTEVSAWIADPKRKIETTVWDDADGITLHAGAPAYFGPPAAKSADGKLWFLTGESSVDVVDPRHLPDNKLAPPVHIEEIVADHETYWQNLPEGETSNVRLPALTHDLQIDYTALSLAAPEKDLFRYKLEGVDRDWKDVGNRRQAFYSNLSPGRYHFRVIACNNSGVWNEKGDTLEFSVAPAYYQMNWFRALCGLFLLALLWAGYQFRVGQLQREFDLSLQARVAERMRIARELHDTLLQSFHGVLLRLETVSQLLREHPTEAREKLDNTIEQAAEAITEGRDAVQGLRESTVQQNDLARAIETLGEELAIDSIGHRPAFRLAVEGEARNLHPILRDEIYRISAEALRNAFQHAQARQIEVEIRYDDQQFRLRMRDDGKGMDPAVLTGQEPKGHFGLHGMRERAKLAGGTLTVWSEVGSGTEVELRIPADTAYTTAWKRPWWSRMFAGRAKYQQGARSGDTSR